MKITMIYNTVHAFATQRNATQRNATQRNAYQNYILNNNFKFYIFQFFKAFNFLSAVFGFAKIISLIKNSFGKNNLSFAETKVRLWRGVLWERGDSRSNPTCLYCHDFLRSLAMTIKNKFAILNNNVALAHCVNNSEKSTQGVSQRDAEAKTPCYKKWIASLISFVRNDNFNYAFSFDAFNFEIISRNENYAFNYNKYFCRNGNNRIDGLFSRNDYGGKFIFGFWNNLNFGFLFNRKIKKNKFMSAL